MTKNKLRVIQFVLILLIPAILLCGCKHSTDDDYAVKEELVYVSADGSPDATGTQEDPYSTIQEAIDEANPGTTIQIGEGTYDEQVSFPQSGTENQPIVLCGTVGPNGEMLTHLTYTGSEEDINLIDCNGQSYIQIRDLDIGGIESKYVCGIFISEGSNHIEIRNNIIHDICVAKEYLISPEEQEEKAGEGNAILCLGEGVSKAKAISHITIDGNEICDNITNWSEAVSVAGNVEQVSIVGNLVHDNTNIGIDFNGNTGYCKDKNLDQPRDCEAINNTIYNCHCEYASCAGLYVDGAKDTLLKGNEVYGCDYGIEVGAEEPVEDHPTKGITVTENRMHDNKQGALWIGGYDEEASGLVADCAITDNHMENNGEVEICINRCRNITFQGNEVRSAPNNAGIVYGEMDKNHTQELYFTQNKYIIYNDLPKFELHGMEIQGIQDWNQYIQGTDTCSCMD